MKQPDGVLARESNFLGLMIAMQVGKVTVFTVWSVKLSKTAEKWSEASKAREQKAYKVPTKKALKEKE